MRQLVLSLLLSLTFLTPAFAIKAEYTTFTVNGITYNVPIPNKNTREDFYLLHKALDGDKFARQMLLGNERTRYFYIGDDDAVRWLILTHENVRVIEKKIGA